MADFEVLATLWRELYLAKAAVVNAQKDDQHAKSKRALDGAANTVIVELV